MSAVEQYVRNVAEDVRDLRIVIHENGQRLLDNSESIQDLVNEYGRCLLDIGEDVRDIKKHNEKSRKKEDQILRGIHFIPSETACLRDLQNVNESR